MEAFIGDLKERAKENEFFREVLYTGAKAQLVVMSLAPDQDIGEETHEVDQFFYVVDGEGVAVLGGRPAELEKGSAVYVPAGMRHNFIAGSGEPMRLFTIYAPPQHPAGTVHRTKADATEDVPAVR